MKSRTLRSDLELIEGTPPPLVEFIGSDGKFLCFNKEEDEAYYCITNDNRRCRGCLHNFEEAKNSDVFEDSEGSR